VGSVRETVTKVIGELTREGYIRSGYGKLVLENPSGLERLSKEAA
jgi:CRP-like cAMP-binding protein